MLLVRPLSTTETCLPSPYQLRRKIIIKVCDRDFSRSITSYSNVCLFFSIKSWLIDHQKPLLIFRVSSHSFVYKQVFYWWLNKKIFSFLHVFILLNFVNVFLEFIKFVFKFTCLFNCLVKFH